MFSHLPDHVKGLLLAAVGGLTLTVDIPFLRLANGEAWSVMLTRSIIVVAVTVLFVAVMRMSGQGSRRIIPGVHGWIVAALYGLSTVTFMIAVFNTTTANLVFILAFNPMFAALLSWMFMGERPKGVTLIAMILMAVGVFIIVEEGLGTGNLFGDLMSLAASFCIAAAIVITRASGKDMSFAPMVGSALPALVAGLVVAQQGYAVEQPWWLLVNGLIIFPISFIGLAAAPRFIPGAEVAMFYLLETVLAPVWVWMIFAEVPTRQSAIGGTILIATLLAHSMWQLHSGRKRKAVTVPRHPT